MSEDQNLKTFAQDLHALEELVKRMEHDELDLNQALVDFEKGIALSKKCQKTLEQAQLKIKTLSQDIIDDGE